MELAGSEEVDLNLSTDSLPSPRSGAPMLPGVEDVMRKWNMFQLGKEKVTLVQNMKISGSWRRDYCDVILFDPLKYTFISPEYNT